VCVFVCMVCVCDVYRPNPGIKPRSPALHADSLPLSHQGSPLYTVGPQSPSVLAMSGCKMLRSNRF